MDPTTLVRPALGQAASIGDLYNARTDTFSTVSVFTKQPTPAAITSVDNNSSSIKYVHTDSYKEKFEQFGLSAQLSASVAAGLIEVGGSGQYLTSRRESNLTIQSSLIYNITTVTERINFQLQGLENCLAVDILRGKIATHVVSEITWGSRNVVTVRQEISRNDDANQATGSLHARLKSLNIGAGGELAEVNAEKTSEDSFEIVVEGDVVATDGLVPTTLASAEAFIRNIPRYIEATNGGKGKPLSYTLLSLSDLARLLKVQIAKQITLRELSSDCAEQFVHAFDEIVSVRQEIKDVNTLLWRNKSYISTKDLHASTEAVFQIQNLETRLRKQYKEAIEDVRTGKDDERVLRRALNDFKFNEASLNQLMKLDFHALKEKIHFITGLVAMGAMYLGYNNRSLELELGSTPDMDVYVFNFNEASVLHSREWAKSILILYQLLREEGASSRMLIRDCGAVEGVVECPKIVLYRNAEVVNDDIIELRNHPTARCDTGYLDPRGTSRPVSRVLVTMPCPGKSCSRTAKHDWICSKCSCRIEYGHIDDYIYCDCGRCDYKHWEFRCPDPGHSPGFSSYEQSALLGMLKQLEPVKECNILILGRTGVGKSTWINSLANYLTYPTLESALEADSFLYLIPFAFSTYKTNEEGEYESIKVQAGFDYHSAHIPETDRATADDEQDGSTGQSATQRTVVRCVQYGDYRVRLIDTPGIGDTRGAARDKENMADLLNVLQAYDNLHGILILLKPNEQKLDLMFRFCMQELLTHLHRDAAKNIAFGFTNTRGTNYRPGDSFGPLHQLLKRFADIDIALRKHNVYCFDSESFRHLAARRLNDQCLGEPEENSRSWKHSVCESKRLIEYFKGLKPHKTTSSINLYATRKLVVKLTGPMADIAGAIQRSLNVANDQMRELKVTEYDRKSLEDRRKQTVITFIISPTEMPRTTCHDKDCISHVGTGSFGQDGKEVNSTVYHSMCHSPCHLSGVKVDNIGNAKLRGCAAMENGRCKACGHSWKLHLHISYEQIPKTVEKDDPKIVRELDENASLADMKRALIARKECYIEELRSELQEVTYAAVHFSNFLKHNSIMPYNDATLDYLDRTIEDKRGHVADGGSRDELDALEKYRKQYEKEIEILNKHMENGEDSKLLDQAGVEKLLSKLYSLPHYGEDLKAIQTVLSRTQPFEQRERSHVYRTKIRTPKKKKKQQQQQSPASRGGFWEGQFIGRAFGNLGTWRS